MSQEKGNQHFLVLQSDYTAWLSQVMLAVQYDDISSRRQIVFPNLLPEKTDAGMPIPSRIRDSQAILHEMARTMLGLSGRPEREAMETFLATSENFQAALQQLEHGIILADFGIDELTGLRNQDKMITDLERELERRSRRGQPFCFAISQIDGVEARKDPKNIVLAARCVEKTIRSFDDAYVTGEGEFLSSLKHSDNSGGLKFVARLNNILSNNPDVTFTMSSIVAEPLPGDTILQLIANARHELEVSAVGKKGFAEQYEEVSPLSQYLKSLKEKS